MYIEKMFPLGTWGWLPQAFAKQSKKHPSFGKLSLHSQLRFWSLCSHPLERPFLPVICYVFFWSSLTLWLASYASNITPTSISS